MKSNKQRRAEIKQLRLARAARIEAQLRSRDGRHLCAAGMAPADHAVLARYNNSCFLPEHYLDRAFNCRDCGSQEVWTAKQQKWWYEVVHAPIDSAAVRCLACRRARRAVIAESQAAAGADRLALETRALRALGCAAPTDDARAQVESALQSKWWGVRAVAVGVLGQWRRDADVQRLMRMVDDAEDEASAPSSAWARTRRAAALKALQACVTPAHAPWVLERCLKSYEAWRWSAFLHALPRATLDACAAAEMARNDIGRLGRLCHILRALGLDAHDPLVKALQHHPLEAVAKTARQWLPAA